MDKLLEFLLNTISKEDIQFEKKEDSDVITYIVKPNKEKAGLIIGKKGKMIKAITQILKIKAVIDKKRVFVDIEPLQ